MGRISYRERERGVCIYHLYIWIYIGMDVQGGARTVPPASPAAGGSSPSPSRSQPVPNPFPAPFPPRSRPGLTQERSRSRVCGCRRKACGSKAPPAFPAPKAPPSMAGPRRAEPSRAEPGSGQAAAGLPARSRGSPALAKYLISLHKLLFPRLQIILSGGLGTILHLATHMLINLYLTLIAVYSSTAQQLTHTINTGAAFIHITPRSHVE